MRQAGPNSTSRSTTLFMPHPSNCHIYYVSFSYGKCCLAPLNNRSKAGGHPHAPTDWHRKNGMKSPRRRKQGRPHTNRSGGYRPKISRSPLTRFPIARHGPNRGPTVRAVRLASQYSGGRAELFQVLVAVFGLHAGKDPAAGSSIRRGLVVDEGVGREIVAEDQIQALASKFGGE